VGAACGAQAARNSTATATIEMTLFFI
jgi:hypothetical protein